MSVTQNWTEPSTLDLATDDFVEESHWDAILSNLLWLGRTVEPSLTNKSGGALSAGDVVVPDTSNDNAVTTTTTASHKGPVGVAMATTLNNAAGRIAYLGVVSVKCTGAVNRGDFLATSTVAASAVSVGSLKTQNSFAIALTAASGGYCTALLLPTAAGLDIRIARQSANQTVSSSTTLVDTSLTFPIGANETWIFLSLHKCDGGSSIGFRIGFNGPSSPSAVAAQAAFQANSAMNIQSPVTAYGTIASSSVAGGSGSMGCWGYVANGANAGTVSIQFANGAAAGTTTFHNGGILIAMRIA